MRADSLGRLNGQLVRCRLCPRLVRHREQVARVKRPAYARWAYWGRPVPGFGDARAKVLILGLAPGAHGSNRTGRMFTGDGSGNFLYRILYKAGFANRPVAVRRGDGLALRTAYITAAARCVPPQNKPTPTELLTCSRWLDRELALLKKVRVVVALGRVAWDAWLAHLRRKGIEPAGLKPKFAHGAEVLLPDGRTLLGTYHPSQQNTFTGKLTPAQMLAVFRRARALARGRERHA